MAVCVVHLIRHADYGGIAHVLTGRTPGATLSEAGRDQARSLAARFSGSDIRAVLTSPVQRARETAEPIAAALNLSPSPDPGLEEVDFGHWAGQPFAALAAEAGWADWNRTRSLACPPGGERMLGVQARAVASLFAQRSGGGQVVAVSHADVIKSVLAFVLGMPLDFLHRIEIAAASRSVVVLGTDFARVEAINLPP